MRKLSNSHVRNKIRLVRVSETEDRIIQNLAKKSKASVAGFMRAAALNRTGDERAVFYAILNELVRARDDYRSAAPGPAKEQALAASTACMRWAIKHK